MHSEMFVMMSDSLEIIGGLLSFICQHVELFSVSQVIWVERVLPLKVKQQNKIVLLEQ